VGGNWDRNPRKEKNGVKGQKILPERKRVTPRTKKHTGPKRCQSFQHKSRGNRNGGGDDTESIKAGKKKEMRKYTLRRKGGWNPLEKPNSRERGVVGGFIDPAAGTLGTNCASSKKENPREGGNLNTRSPVEVEQGVKACQRTIKQ